MRRVRELIERTEAALGAPVTHGRIVGDLRGRPGRALS